MKIKPDIIVTWPKSGDFPLWRQFIRNRRSYFEKVIIVFMETNQGHDYRKFIRNAMEQDNCLFLDEPPRPAWEDWRNNCVNYALSCSNSEWVWFTEQDFFTRDGFWEDVEKGLKDNAKAIFTDDNGRMHPCCIFIERETLNKTSRDFSAQPAKGYDHFGKLQADLKGIEGIWVHKVDPKTYKHYNGLSQNFYLMAQNQRPNYKEREFVDYLSQCLAVNVELDSQFVNEVRNYFAKIEPEMALLI